MTRDDLRAALAHPNVQAFLQVIRAGEGTLDVLDGYRRMFTGPLFDSFAQHPNQIHQAGALASTAAGAYQFLHRTWQALVEQYHFEDFSPQCQDEGAVALIAGRGALADVMAGQLGAAIGKCNREWASLPGSPWGQPTRTMAQATKTYTQAGGTLADPAAAPQHKEAPMAPLLLPLAGALIDIFTPLAREKITKEMARHTDKPEVAEQIAAGVIETAKVLTGKTDPIAAVAAVKDGGPDLVASVEADALAQLDRLLGVVERAYKMEREDIAEARRYNSEEPLFLDTPWLKLKFIHLLSLVFVGFSGTFVTVNWASLTAELRGAVITLMVIAGWNGVRDYWMSSSAGSTLKTQLLSTRKQDG
jgi:muramidase (phage lysozyme)